MLAATVHILIGSDYTAYHILPINRLRIISLPVIFVVWYNVKGSSVEESASAYPKGSMRGIHPTQPTVSKSHSCPEQGNLFTSSIFQCKATLVHFVLLRRSSHQVMHVASFVHFHLQVRW